MKILVIIPSHLASIRFPKKILHPIKDLPMIEHVRRRALLAEEIDDVLVTTCDNEIKTVIEKFGGKVIMSSNLHLNGTSRISEIIDKVNCTHVIILQGDEPLILPSHIDFLAKAIKKNFKKYVAFNLTAPINSKKELKKHSFVKASIKNNNIINCFRIFNDSKDAQHNIEIRKILGVIGYEKNFLKQFNKLTISKIEKEENIEQIRIIQNNYNLQSIPVNISLPSVNEKEDLLPVLNELENNKKQIEIYNKIMNWRQNIE